jgi:hypothetical protein
MACLVEIHSDLAMGLQGAVAILPDQSSLYGVPQVPPKKRTLALNETRGHRYLFLPPWLKPGMDFFAMGVLRI